MVKKKRTPVKIDTLVAVLYKADHCCCMCRNKNTRPTIHHIDENPENNKEDNLMPLCLNHQNEVHTKTTMTRNYSKKELKMYKSDWEQDVKHMRATLRNPLLAQIVRFDGGDTNIIYLSIENILRPFQDELTFRLMGFQWGNVDVYPEEDYKQFEIGAPLQRLGACEEIQLKLRDGTPAAEVFIIWEGRRHHVPNPVTLAIIQQVDLDKIDWSRIRLVGLNEFNAIPKGNPVLSAFDFVIPEINDGKLTVNLHL